ncbi:site-specific tyrosine recombinase XerC [Limihaloglobus sulfuriphilus]|uniref:Site-specific tyrosine recombinase XerC n=1 Tax=Limihaloglobus sulfuriphilus TaxID=1851148 RepID=A0A1Q2MFI1_9BACT|nr:tyrosine-type recombinase/integrase [Limihaloglobus sulfuriphilus]AQQ71419.1 site-specific tyrosine recombinase XerC [Limihaloglobus sulfuriphilus]
MKTEYRMYGRDSEKLADSISDADNKILAGYLRYCSTTAGPKKVNDYRRYMLQFMDVIEKPLDKITKDDAIDFWALVNHSTHELQTKIMMRRTVKRFLKWFYRDLDMLEALKNTKGPLVNPKKINKSVLFKPDEIRRMLHAAERIRDKALLMLLVETGARPQEIRDLKWGDVNLDEKEVHLYSSKTARDRDLPILHSFPYIFHWYENWAFPDPMAEDYVFPALVKHYSSRNKSISTSYMNRIIQSLANKAGVNRRVNTYLLRHTRLTEVYKLGVKGVEHNKFAGHTPGSKHQNVYVHLDNRDLKQALMKNVYSKDVAVANENFQTQPVNNTGTASIQMIQQQMLFLQQELLKLQAVDVAGGAANRPKQQLPCNII